MAWSSSGMASSAITSRFFSPENCPKGLRRYCEMAIFKNTENADQRWDLGVQYIIPRNIEKWCKITEIDRIYDHHWVISNISVSDLVEFEHPGADGLMILHPRHAKGNPELPWLAWTSGSTNAWCNQSSCRPVTRQDRAPWTSSHDNLKMQDVEICILTIVYYSIVCIVTTCHSDYSVCFQVLLGKNVTICSDKDDKAKLSPTLFPIMILNMKLSERAYFVVCLEFIRFV